MILREIKIRWKSLLFWAIGFAFMIIGGMTKFDTFSAGGSQDLNQFIQSMPRIMRIIYGMEGIDISTFTGYFGLLLLYVLIMASIHGAFLGASLIHQEFKDRTADFLFVKPMSRDHILFRKLGSGLVMILILEAVIAASCFYVFNESGQLPLFGKTLAATLATHVFFFGLGFLFTVLLPKSRQGQQLALVIILVSYLSISLSQLYDQPWIRNLSPIGWYYARLYQSGTSELWLAGGILLTLSLGFLVLAIVRFRRKDIPN